MLPQALEQESSSGSEFSLDTDSDGLLVVVGSPRLRWRRSCAAGISFSVLVLGILVVSHYFREPPAKNHIDAPEDVLKHDLVLLADPAPIAAPTAPTVPTAAPTQPTEAPTAPTTVPTQPTQPTQEPTQPTPVPPTSSTPTPTAVPNGYIALGADTMCRGTGWSGGGWPRGVGTQTVSSCAAACSSTQGCTAFDIVLTGSRLGTCHLFGHASVTAGVSAGAECYKKAPTAAPTAPPVPTAAPTRPTQSPTAPTTAPTQPTVAPTQPTQEPTQPTPRPTALTPTPTASLLSDLQFVFEAMGSSATSLSDPITGMALRAKPITTYAGHACWNLDNDYLEYQSGNRPAFGQIYTHAVWVYWRISDSGWRTLIRPSSGHSVLTRTGTKDLGMYSNRNGQFRDSGYDISNDMSSWQLVIVIGQGVSPISSVGTSTFYTAAEGDTEMVMRGTADRVVSGTQFLRLGWPGQGPGKVAAAYGWSRALSATEMNSLLTNGVSGRLQAITPVPTASAVPSSTPTQPSPSPTAPTKAPTQPTATPTQPTQGPTQPTPGPTAPTPTPTAALHYQGCYHNAVPNRVYGHVAGKTITQCEALAKSRGKVVFGMEYPQGYGTPGLAYCLVLDGLPSMNSLADTDCEAEGLFNGFRLGGYAALAVYSTEALPTTAPTASPTAPTSRPSALPTSTPSTAPSARPTTAPTPAPSARPTAAPTTAPSARPTAGPTPAPSARPTATPTTAPSARPTAGPTFAPSARPTAVPTQAPSVRPTAGPTPAPRARPTSVPTPVPSAQPTVVPTHMPSVRPTAVPTPAPSARPTAVPTQAPSARPTFVPTPMPSARPTTVPTPAPSARPTVVPTQAPSARPTAVPTPAPSARPTAGPTPAPSARPTSTPTATPTPAPSVRPTAVPTTAPSAAPTIEVAQAESLSAAPTPLPTASSLVGAAQPLVATPVPTPSDECFPGEATVHVQEVGPTAIAHLGIGDPVLVADPLGRLAFEPILGFLHVVHAGRWNQLRYFKLVHSYGILRASANHLVFVADDLGQPFGSFSTRSMAELQAGDRVWVSSSVCNGTCSSTDWVLSEVLSKQQETTASGLYAPVTPSGTLFVDGVLCSAYAAPHGTRITHAAMHASLFLLRAYEFVRSTALLQSRCQTMFSTAGAAAERVCKEVGAAASQYQDLMHPFAYLLFQHLQLHKLAVLSG